MSYINKEQKLKNKETSNIDNVLDLITKLTSYKWTLKVDPFFTKERTEYIENLGNLINMIIKMIKDLKNNTPKPNMIIFENVKERELDYNATRMKEVVNKLGNYYEDYRKFYFTLMNEHNKLNEVKQK